MDLGCRPEVSIFFPFHQVLETTPGVSGVQDLADHVSRPIFQDERQGGSKALWSERREEAGKASGMTHEMVG